MSDELEFFLFLLERYASARGLMSGDVLRAWDERGITAAVYDNYFLYHQEALENAFDDIDSLMATGAHAW